MHRDPRRRLTLHVGGHGSRDEAPNEAPAPLESDFAFDAEHTCRVARFGTWFAQGEDPTRIEASLETLRLLDIETGADPSVSTTLLRHVRFEELVRLHRAALRRRHFIKRQIRIVLRDGNQRRLLARVIAPVHGDEERSFGTLVDVTERSTPRVAAR